MPGPTENATRLEIVQRHQKGETLRSISAELHMSYETVKKVWRHWQRKGSVEPNYELAQRRGTRQYSTIQQLAIELKRQHPGWGAQLILLEIQHTHPQLEHPTIRTLQRWFMQAGISRSTLVRKQPAMSLKRGQSVHQVWAVDAKENIRLQNESRVSWLTISDEASGAILQTEVFPPTVLGSCEPRNSTSQPQTCFSALGATAADPI